MAEVKIVLKRSPMDPENGVWIDGQKLDGVVEVTAYGASREIPYVVINLLPKTLILGLENPDIEKTSDEPKN